MATISSPGIGSGLDIKSIVSQLVAIEKQPLTGLKVKAAQVQTKISAYGEIKSLVSGVSDAVSKLNSLTTWNSVSATSSKPDNVSATAIGGTAANSFSAKVENLAKAQSYASASITGGGAIGAGTLSIAIGSYGTPPGAFTPKVGSTAVDIAVDADDTLTDVASKINGSNAGVSATILNDGSGERLLLRSKTTGLEAGFQVTVTDADGGAANDYAGLSRVLQAGLTNSAAVTQYGENAQVKVNESITVTSASNTFTNIVSGVTLTLKDGTASGTTAEINVAPNTSAITKAIDDFVAAYNKLNDMLSEATKYDQGTKTPGLLQGDSFAIGIQNAMRGILQSTTSGSAFSRLADIGVTQQLGGNLAVDSTKLTEALKSPEDLKNLFRIDNSTNSTDGVGLKLNTFATGLLNADGLFKTREDSLKRALELNSKDQQRLNEKVARIEAQLNRRYSALDAQVSSLTALNNYVSQQVAQWNKTNS